MKVLMAWLGMADLRATGSPAPLSGPIGQAVSADAYDSLVLLVDQPEESVSAYVEWLKSCADLDIEVRPATLTSPTHFRDIHTAASAALDHVVSTYRQAGEPPEVTLHLSPGTPAMSAVWILLGRTRVPARLIQSSEQRGVEEADVPFQIAAEYIPELTRAADGRRRAKSAEAPPEDARFGDILYKSPQMARVVTDAQRAARRNLPILIEGESGTGKELLARAIHNASPRASGPFVVVNCGAIPAELVESEFFGHRRGAFTGAVTDRIGAFEDADGGTLFLDEIGELPLPAQVTLLRALQEGEIKRIGDTRTRAVDVRIMAATNRGLIAEVVEGRFREDLYYRLAVATLDLPALRERQGDLGFLADRLLEQVNEDARDEPDFIPKKFSVSSRNLVLRHHWPGNIRELLNTLRRVTLYAESSEISEEDMARAIRPLKGNSLSKDTLLESEIGEGFDINERISVLARHYLKKAMQVTGGNKTRAAALLGLGNAQTLANWLKKYKVD